MSEPTDNRQKARDNWDDEWNDDWSDPIEPTEAPADKPKKNNPSREPPESEPKRAGAPTSPGSALPPNSETSPLAEFLPPKKWLFLGGLGVIAVALFAIVNINSLIAVYNFLNGVLEPLFIGAVIAYLCNPIMRFYEYVVFRKLKASGWRLGLSLLLTGLTVVGVLAAIIALIIPELVNSLNQLVTNFDSYTASILSMAQNVVNMVTARIPSLEIDVSSMEAIKKLIVDSFGSMGNALSELVKLLQKYVLNKESLGTMAGILTTLFNTLKNVVLGLFIAIYILSSKEKRVAQIRKFRKAFLSHKQDAKVTEVVQLVDRTFGGYLRGMIIDALAVGVITFIALSIFRISDYNLLIAAICALTNIIPVFGPFIGAIPSGFIVLITNPSKLIWFILIIIVIQQIDGNILVPKIQGNNTGISSLAVLVAITVMGNLFGVIGMIIGVPIFAVIIELFKRFMESFLRRQGAPTDTTAYYPSNSIVNAEEDVYYEHAHLRYKYEHSKLKVKVDEALEHAMHRHDGKDAEADGEATPAKDKKKPRARRTPKARPKASAETEFENAESVAPETDAPETDAPETDAPEADAPEAEIAEPVAVKQKKKKNKNKKK